MKIEVYTDGSATVATNPGGWGAVIVIDGAKHSELSGSMEKASNNDAELEAAIQGLKEVLLMRVKDPSTYSNAEVTLVSDSEIVLGWTNGTYRFKQKAKMEKFNTLKTLAARLRVHTRWVEGHTGDVHNERCDELANIARKKLVADGLGETNKALGLMIDGLMNLPAKPKKPKKEKTVSITFDLEMDQEMLYNMGYVAWEHAKSGGYEPGSNYWMTMFTDKLKEQMDIVKPYTLKVRR